MLDFLLKRVLSLALSLATVYVPHKKWQQALDALPPLAERVAHHDVPGWSHDTVTSPHTGQLHSWYYCPSKDTASNRVLVFLHGLNTDGSIFSKLAPLSATHTLIAYNFPERSALYTGSIRDFGILLDDFCKVKQFDTIDLLGNSLGGIIAGFFAAHSEQVTVNTLTLVSTYLPGATEENIRQIRGMADKLLPYPDYKLYYLLNLGEKISRVTGKKGSDEPQQHLVIKHTDWYRQVLKSQYWYNCMPFVSRITCPVLVIYGKLDRLIKPAEVDAFRKYLPQARVTVSEDGGHLLVFSHPELCIGEMRKQVR